MFADLTKVENEEILSKSKLVATIIILIVIAAEILNVNCQVYSLYAYEYYNSTYEPDDTAYIQGYYGAAYAYVENINEDENKDIHCMGAYSCYKTRTLQSDEDLRCRGMFSCAFSRLIHAINKVTACVGELSCYGANISTTDIESYISGAAAGMNAYLYPANSNHFIYGYMGLANAIAESSNSGTYRFYMVCHCMIDKFCRLCLCLCFDEKNIDFTVTCLFVVTWMLCI